MANAGHEVIHLCPGDVGSLEKQGVKIITFPPPRNLLNRALKLPMLFIMGGNIDADCYHCNEVDSWVVGVLLKIFRRKRCIFDVHEHYPSTFSERRFPVWLRPLVYNLVRLVFLLLTPFTDKLVLAKETVSSDFLCSKQKKILVRNFTPLSGIGFAGQRSLPTDSELPVTLVHLGLINKARGWGQVLKALDKMKCKNVRLEVIGTFDDGSRCEFDAAVKSFDLVGRIEVYDWMPFDKAFEHLVKAHIGLVVFQPGILNHVYAMPHKMFDYMAAGMAVICPEFAVEIAPIVRESGCGLLVDSSSVENLAQAIDYMVSSPAVLMDMGRKGQIAVREKYNWEEEAKKLVEIYGDLSK